MEQTSCHSLRDSLVAYFAQEVEVATYREKCVVTLPLNTLDGSFISIYLEDMLNGLFVVNDGGKTVADLFAQGIHLTDTRNASLTTMARRLGASFSNGVFEVGCKREKIYDAIFAISQCCALASIEVLQVKPVVEEEPISVRVGRSLQNWKPDYVSSITSNVSVKGLQAHHSFSFVSFSSTPHHTVAVKIVAPTYGARVAAERYGYLAKDIEGTFFSQWRRLAVITKAADWNDEALKIVENNSTRIVTLKSEEEQDLETLLPSVMDRLAS